MKNVRKNPSFLLANIIVVLIVEDQGVTLENLGFAVSALENLLLGVRFQALPKLVGKKFKILLGELYVNRLSG